MGPEVLAGKQMAKNPGRDILKKLGLWNEDPVDTKRTAAGLLGETNNEDGESLSVLLQHMVTVNTRKNVNQEGLTRLRQI